MVEQLTGSDAVSARSLARGTGISQETLSRWLREARSLPLMGPRRHKSKTWSIDEKIRVLAEASKLSGSELNSLLERELARKEKALAEAAALLVLKKKLDHLQEDEDDDTDEGSEQ